jgi:glycosyltransferase involved in cell wall biosynthesis
MQDTLTVIIITHNAALTLEATLMSVSFANEIIIVDSGSDDETLQIAKRFTDQVVVTKDWPGFGVQKNRALDLARSSWVLSLDADEVLTEPLQAEIQNLLKSERDFLGYAIPARLHFQGRVLRYGICYRERVLRLFKRGFGRFTDDLVHERLVVNGSVSCLHHFMLHHSYQSIEHLLTKSVRYARLGAEVRYARGVRGGLFFAIVHALGAFFKFFVLRLGFLDGSMGFVLAITASFAAFYRYVLIGMLHVQADQAVKPGVRDF